MAAPALDEPPAQVEGMEMFLDAPALQSGLQRREDGNVNGKESGYNQGEEGADGEHDIPAGSRIWV